MGYIVTHYGPDGCAGYNTDALSGRNVRDGAVVAEFDRLTVARKEIAAASTCARKTLWWGGCDLLEDAPPAPGAELVDAANESNDEGCGGWVIWRTKTAA